MELHKMDKQFKQKNQFRRIVAATTAFLFTMISVSWAQPLPSVNLEPQSLWNNRLASEIKIPEGLGSIQTHFTVQSTQNPSLVVVIQDAHSVLDAQTHITDLIRYFRDHYGIKLVALEGAAGKLDTTLLKSFPDPYIKRKIMTDYLKNGELTGGEMASIFDSKETGYYGIEDWNLYEANYWSYLRAMQQKEDIHEELNDIKAAFDRERKQVYSAKLNEFHEQLERFEDENAYLPELLGYLGRMDTGLERIRANPHLAKLYLSFEFEKENTRDQLIIDTSLRQLANTFKTKYSSKMDKKQRMVLHKNYQAYVTREMDAAAFVKYLIETGKILGVKARLTPSLLGLLGHYETLSSMKGTKVFDELLGIIREIENSLITKPEERSLAEKYRKIKYLKSLASLEMTREQFRAFQDSPEDALSVMKDGKEQFEHAIEFYRLATERDQAFRENLKTLMEKTKNRSAIVLAGGFHAQGIEQGLKEDNIPYVVVTPKIESLAGQELYPEVMRGKLSYKPYLKTTFYDAFMRHSTMRLVSALNEPDFRKNLKLWRDQIIRLLSKEGRLKAAGDYTRYLDLLFKAYDEKYGRGEYKRKPKEELMMAFEKELDGFRDETVNSLWEKFQSQVHDFTRGLAHLIADKKLNADRAEALLDRVSQSKVSVLVAPRLALIADFHAKRLVQYTRTEIIPGGAPAVNVLQARSKARTQNARAEVRAAKKKAEALDRLRLIHSLHRNVRPLSAAERKILVQLATNFSYEFDSHAEYSLEESDFFRSPAYEILDDLFTPLPVKEQTGRFKSRIASFMERMGFDLEADSRNGVSYTLRMKYLGAGNHRAAYQVEWTKSTGESQSLSAYKVHRFIPEEKIRQEKELRDLEMIHQRYEKIAPYFQKPLGLSLNPDSKMMITYKSYVPGETVEELTIEKMRELHTAYRQLYDRGAKVALDQLESIYFRLGQFMGQVFYETKGKMAPDVHLKNALVVLENGEVTGLYDHDMEGGLAAGRDMRSERNLATLALYKMSRIIAMKGLWHEFAPIAYSYLAGYFTAKSGEMTVDRKKIIKNLRKSVHVNLIQKQDRIDASSISELFNAARQYFIKNPVRSELRATVEGEKGVGRRGRRIPSTQEQKVILGGLQSAWASLPENERSQLKILYNNLRYYPTRAFAKRVAKDTDFFLREYSQVISLLFTPFPKDEKSQETNEMEVPILEFLKKIGIPRESYPDVQFVINLRAKHLGGDAGRHKIPDLFLLKIAGEQPRRVGMFTVSRYYDIADFKSTLERARGEKDTLDWIQNKFPDTVGKHFQKHYGVWIKNEDKTIILIKDYASGRTLRTLTESLIEEYSEIRPYERDQSPVAQSMLNALQNIYSAVGYFVGNFVAETGQIATDIHANNLVIKTTNLGTVESVTDIDIEGGLVPLQVYDEDEAGTVLRDSEEDLVTLPMTNLSYIHNPFLFASRDNRSFYAIVAHYLVHYFAGKLNIPKSELKPELIDQVKTKIKDYISEDGGLRESAAPNERYGNYGYDDTQITAVYRIVKEFAAPLLQDLVSPLRLPAQEKNGEQGKKAKNQKKKESSVKRSEVRDLNRRDVFANGLDLKGELLSSAGGLGGFVDLFKDAGMSRSEARLMQIGQVRRDALADEMNRAKREIAAWAGDQLSASADLIATPEFGGRLEKRLEQTYEGLTVPESKFQSLAVKIQMRMVAPQLAGEEFPVFGINETIDSKVMNQWLDALNRILNDLKVQAKKYPLEFILPEEATSQDVKDIQNVLKDFTPLFSDFAILHSAGYAVNQNDWKEFPIKPRFVKYDRGEGIMKLNKEQELSSRVSGEYLAVTLLQGNESEFKWKTPPPYLPFVVRGQYAKLTKELKEPALRAMLIFAMLLKQDVEDKIQQLGFDDAFEKGADGMSLIVEKLSELAAELKVKTFA